MTDQTPPPARNFYGRRKGKTLKASQKRRMKGDLQALSLGAADPHANPERRRISPEELFADARPLWLEIGFGGGEHMVHQAAANPQAGLIGCEPFVNGVAMALGKIAQVGVDNIRLHPGDVRDLFDVLPDACIERAFLLYPDPWPKTRHHRRRFVTPQYLQPLARVMVAGGEFRVATDIPDYVRQTLKEVARAGFECLSPQRDDWAQPWPDWITTRYEAKALREGRQPNYLTFRRKG